MVALLLDFHLMCLQSFVYQLFCCISVVTIAQNFEVIFPQITSTNYINRKNTEALFMKQLKPSMNVKKINSATVI